MIKVSRQQILDRWDTLPENLKESLFSEGNSSALWRICENQHLTEDKIRIVATLAGDVILGFLHSDDLAQEIRSELGLNPEIANSIASEIDRKIFSPIRNDLEKAYAPPLSETPEALDLRTAATEIKPAVEAPVAEAEAPKIIPQEEKKPEAIKPSEISPTPVPSEQVAPAVEGPLIIHKETEFKPLVGTKRSLGGLFSFLKKKEGREKKEEAVKAQVEMGGPVEEAPVKEGVEPAVVSRAEPPKVRVVHYSQFEPAVSPFPAETEKPPEVKPPEAKLPENLPVVSEDEPPIEIKPQEEIKPTEVSPGPTLDLRQKPAAVQPSSPPETKPKSEEKKQDEEIIDLSKF